MKWAVCLIAVIALLVGCATLEQYVTPARIEAVAALSGYLGGKEAIKSGHKAEIAAATEALRVIGKADKVDLLAVSKAVEAAGLTWLQSDEGYLGFTAGVILFQDLWSGKVEKVLDDARARALVNGLVRGFDYALGDGVTRAGPRPASVEQMLRDQAIRTRK